MLKKSSLTRGFSLSFLLLGALAAAPAAHALVADHSGTICKSYNANEAGYIDYLPNGICNLNSSPTAVICPTIRRTTNTNGATIWVDVIHTGAQTTTCTAYSFNPHSSSWLATASGSATGSGPLGITLNLVGAGKSTSVSNYSVLCTLPANCKGIITDIDVNEP